MEIAIVILIIAVIFIARSVKVVPQQNAWVKERLGKYAGTLTPGLNFLVPFVDKVAYKHSLKEIPLDVPSQVCITRDIINAQVVQAIDEAALNWGVKVLRYEIKDLTPPKEILHAMQAQITAEREKRALIAASEGRRQEQINIATGEREAFIARSEGEKQAVINKAQGEAESIKAVAEANAQAIERVASAIRQPGGEQAVQLKVAEKAVEAYSQVAADSSTTLIVPSNMTEVSALIGSAMKMVQASQKAA